LLERSKCKVTNNDTLDCVVCPLRAYDREKEKETEESMELAAKLNEAAGH
jgi:MoaA/NifB/PqqE/SkfB family radical SAM enzyme